MDLVTLGRFGYRHIPPTTARRGSGVRGVYYEHLRTPRLSCRDHRCFEFGHIRNVHGIGSHCAGVHRKINGALFATFCHTVIEQVMSDVSVCETNRGT